MLSVPIFDVDYEDLVNDTEQTSRRMIEFLGLQWQDNCNRFHETDRKVIELCNVRFVCDLNGDVRCDVQDVDLFWEGMEDELPIT